MFRVSPLSVRPLAPEVTASLGTGPDKLGLATVVSTTFGGSKHVIAIGTNKGWIVVTTPTGWGFEKNSKSIYFKKLLKTKFVKN